MALVDFWVSQLVLEVGFLYYGHLDETLMEKGLSFLGVCFVGS